MHNWLQDMRQYRELVHKLPFWLLLLGIGKGMRVHLSVRVVPRFQYSDMCWLYCAMCYMLWLHHKLHQLHHRIPLQEQLCFILS